MDIISVKELTLPRRDKSGPDKNGSILA